MKCDCNELRDFVALVDYEDIFDDDTSDGDDKMSLGALLFRKEFFDTGLCLGTDNERLKAFARRTISLAEGRGRQGQAGQGESQKCLVEEPGLNDRAAEVRQFL